jgi:hypothetical protein
LTLGCAGFGSLQPVPVPWFYPLVSVGKKYSVDVVDQRTNEQRIDFLVARIIDIERQLNDLRHTINRQAVRDEVEAVIGERSVEITKSHADAVKILRVLIDSGVVSQEALNEAVR